MVLFRNLSLLWFYVALCLIQPVLAGGTSVQSEKPPFKVGFVMSGPVSNLGWDTAHNDGRLYLEKAMNGRVKTIFAEKIPENSEAARVMEKMIAQGTKVIFLTSYGYLEPGLKVADHHPEVIIMQVSRFNDQQRANVGVYYSFYYETLYAAGIVAGRMTKTNSVGFVLGHRVPPCLASIDVFTLGAHSVNPKLKSHAVFTNSWDDPLAEAEATRGLIERGADIIVSNLHSSLSVCRAAANMGVYSIGMHYDLNSQIPKYWLVGQCHNWGPLYVQLVQSVMDGSWKPGTTTHHYKDGYTKLSSFGQSVPQNVRDEALRSLQKIKDGKLIIFHGPIKDAHSTIRIPAGKVIDDMSLTSIDWVVPGVECAFGKK